MILLQRRQINHWKFFLKNETIWRDLVALLKQGFSVSTIGRLLIGLGIVLWFQSAIVYDWAHLLANAIGKIDGILLQSLTVPLMFMVGTAFILLGQPRPNLSSRKVLHRQSNNQCSHPSTGSPALQQSTKIVAIGGGTGLSALLNGLKHYSPNLTAIVTVADDGGSSGRLRRDYGILPVGDIRNCMTALADEAQPMTELFRFRFQQGEGLAGHSFGNLFLAAMNSMTGDFAQAITTCSELLNIQGKVLPATLSDIHLWAELSDGRRIEGESNITAAKGQIQHIGCTPANPPALPAVIEAIESADYIILGPGSLYTSVIPNLLVPEIREAIARAKAPRIYICNIMTQPGETDGYRVSDHIQAIDRVCGQRLFDSVLVHRGYIPPRLLAVYAEEDSHPVVFDPENVSQLGCQVILDDIAEIDSHKNLIRHDCHRLAGALAKAFNHSSQLCSC